MRIFFGLALAAAVTTVAGAGVAGAQSSSRNTGDRERVDTTFALGQGGTLSVSIYAGRVNVIGASGSSVRIRGTADRDYLRMRGRNSTVSIDMEHGGHGGGADLDITVPIGTRLVMEGFSTPFSVRGVKGEASLETLSGHITLSDAVGKVNLESVSGNIEAENLKGDVLAESVSGRVTIRNVDGDVTTESVSGSVLISGASARRVRAETVSGSLSYDGPIEPAGDYSFTTHSGSLTLAVPNNAGATVSLETFNGSVDSDFPVTLEAGANRGDGESQFEFRIGDGRARITLETFTGGIRIQRGSTRANRE